MKAAVVAALGLTRVKVLVVKPNKLPRTTSGKPHRILVTLSQAMSRSPRHPLRGNLANNELYRQLRPPRITSEATTGRPQATWCGVTQSSHRAWHRTGGISVVDNGR